VDGDLGCTCSWRSLGQRPHPGLGSAAAGSAWVGALLSALFGRVRGESSPRTQRWLTLALNLCAWLAVAGFLVLLSVGVTERSAPAAEIAPSEPSATVSKPAVHLELSGAGAATATINWPADRPPRWQKHFSVANDRYARELTAEVGDTGVRQLDLALLLTLAALALFGRRIDVNKFSLHNMYKLRLVRCYLGASNPPAQAAPVYRLRRDRRFATGLFCAPCPRAARHSARCTLSMWR